MKRETFTKLVKFLEPLMESESYRRAILETALHGSPVLRGISWSGNQFEFTSHMVKHLNSYGTLETGELAIIAILMEVKNQVGVGHNMIIDEMITAIRHEQTSSGEEPDGFDMHVEPHNKPISTISPGNSSGIQVAGNQVTGNISIIQNQMAPEVETHFKRERLDREITILKKNRVQMKDDLKLLHKRIEARGEMSPSDVIGRLLVPTIIILAIAGIVSSIEPILGLAAGAVATGVYITRFRSPKVDVEMQQLLDKKNDLSQKLEGVQQQIIEKQQEVKNL